MHGLRIAAPVFILHITHSSVVVGNKRKSFEEMFVFEMREHSVQTADDNSKLTKKAF